MSSGSMWMLSWRSFRVLRSRAYDTPVEGSSRLAASCGSSPPRPSCSSRHRRFRLILGESWLDSFYRTVVTATLNGLDSPPHGAGGEALDRRGRPRRADYLCVRRRRRRRGDRRWSRERRYRGPEEVEDDQAVGPLHHLRLRPRRPARRAGVPRRGRAVRRARLQRRRARRRAREGDLFIEGNGTEDEDLEEAGLDRARGLVASSDSDADNLYITLSARSKRPELSIVARASDEDASKKLKLAGADRVVTPYSTAGRVMANLVLKPQVTAFLDVVTTAEGDDFMLEEIEVKETCARAGRTIRDLRVRDATARSSSRSESATARSTRRRRRTS